MHYFDISDLTQGKETTASQYAAPLADIRTLYENDIELPYLFHNGLLIGIGRLSLTALELQLAQKGIHPYRERAKNHGDTLESG